jgi:hypothetical protein
MDAGFGCFGILSGDKCGNAWDRSRIVQQRIETGRVQVIGAPTLFATHFHELTAIKGVVGVKNCHMKTTLDLQSSKLTMLYNVADGACDQSFGIHVAEFAGFPEEILQNARERLAELEAGGLPGAQVRATTGTTTPVLTCNPHKCPCLLPSGRTLVCSEIGSVFATGHCAGG